MSRKTAALAFPAVTPDDSDEDLLRLPAAAKRIGVRPDTLKKLAQRGEIPSIKYAKLRLFEPRALREFIAKHRQG